jgi:hypothetical protein
VEAASYVKLYLPEGEIDFVAAPNLTTLKNMLTAMLEAPAAQGHW